MNYDKSFVIRAWRKLASPFGPLGDPLWQCPKCELVQLTPPQPREDFDEHERQFMTCDGCGLASALILKDFAQVRFVEWAPSGRGCSEPYVSLVVAETALERINEAIELVKDRRNDGLTVQAVAYRHFRAKCPESGEEFWKTEQLANLYQEVAGEVETE